MDRCPQCNAVLVNWPQLPKFDGRPVEQVTILVCSAGCLPEPDVHPEYDGYAADVLERAANVLERLEAAR